MINEEFIRHASTDLLAMILAPKGITCIGCPVSYKRTDYCKKSCHEEIVEWLKREVNQEEISEITKKQSITKSTGAKNEP